MMSLKCRDSDASCFSLPTRKGKAFPTFFRKPIFGDLGIQRSLFFVDFLCLFDGEIFLGCAPQCWCLLFLIVSLSSHNGRCLWFGRSRAAIKK